MIYLDTSVALAQLLAEDRTPPAELWSGTVVSSRLLEYELWVRLNARELARTHGERARELTSGLAFLELVPQVLRRALEPFDRPLRTLDALHLASASFLAAQGHDLRIATYDGRLLAAAESLGIPSALPG